MEIKKSINLHLTHDLTFTV